MNERALVWEYIRAIFKDWVGFMSGGGGLALTIGAQFMSSIASPGWFWALGTAACFFACYRAWRQEKIKLVPRLRMLPEVEADNTGHYLAVVENTSEGQSIDSCGVMLDHPQPIIDHWPFALHCSGSPPRPHFETTIELRPGDRRKFAICQFDGTNVSMGAASRTDIVLTPGVYQFTIRAVGKGVPSESRKCRIEWLAYKERPIVEFFD